MKTPTSRPATAYYRVSTAKQGRSGLGLEAQQEAVRAHCRVAGLTLTQEVTEVETGTKKRARPALDRALIHCRVTGAVLLIAKLDRLARNVHFVSGLMESGVDFVALDCPTANRFTIHILAAVAEHEAKLISERTKAALTAARARGVKLGGPLGAKPLLDYGRGHEMGTAAAQAKADDHARTLAPMVAEIRGRDVSLHQIAAELTTRGARTPRGGSSWTPTAVRRLLARIDAQTR